MSTKKITQAGRTWVWPEYDTELIKVFDQYQDIDTILRHVPNRRLVVQAGGACGVWPWYLAQKFAQVVTFEPDLLNFMCMAMNVEGIENITAVNGALTHSPRLLQVKRHPSEETNAGAGYVRVGGDVASMCLDDALSTYQTPIDLLCLDVEGAEGDVLLGASKVIRQWRPVVVIEEKDLPQGIAINARSILEDYGYTERARVNRDVIFKWH